MMGRPGAGRPKPLIQDIFRRGQEVLVQVIKEGIGTKGPTLSTFPISGTRNLSRTSRDLRPLADLGDELLHEVVLEPVRADPLGHAPDRVELYKALASLYRAEHEMDKAWCVAQALVFLGSASDEERMLYEKFRPPGFTPAPRRLTEELWQKAIIHPREDRHVGAIFSSTLGAIAVGAQNIA